MDDIPCQDVPNVHSVGSLTEPLCPDTDYSNGLELGGGGLDNAVDTGANLDDVNCDYLGTCYDGQNNSFLTLSDSSEGSPALAVFKTSLTQNCLQLTITGFPYVYE
jgi:hypothetical protein